MNEMGIDAIYPKMNLSKRIQQAKVCPYLLRNGEYPKVCVNLQTDVR